MKSVVFPLPLHYEIEGQSRTLTLSVIKSGNNVILVDCGLPFSLEKIERQLMGIGLNLLAITAVILTHHDYDHIGSLRALQQALPDVNVYASPTQLPYIQGEVKSLRLVDVEYQLSLPNISPAEKSRLTQLHRNILSVQPGQNVIPIKSGEKIPGSEFVEIIDTRGHMPGHVSVYLHDLKTLVAGDALIAEDGQLCLPNPVYTLDMSEAKKSIRRLERYKIDKVICYHGGQCAINKSSLFSQLTLG